jgi:hypothetical protein
MTSIAKGHVPRGSMSAKTERDKYTHYFLKEGKSPRQDRMI